MKEVKLEWFCRLSMSYHSYVVFFSCKQSTTFFQYIHLPLYKLSTGLEVTGFFNAETPFQRSILCTKSMFDLQSCLCFNVHM